MIVHGRAGRGTLRVGKSDPLKSRGDAMTQQMPEKSKDWLEAEALYVAKHALGCSELRAVRIRPILRPGSGPNWIVAEFVPPLPTVAEINARQAIGPLVGTYALGTA
jgi:hypothetical protein